MRKITFISILLIAALSSLFLTSCSSSDESSSKDSSKSSDGKASAFSASLKAVQDAKSYKFSATVSISGSVGGQETNGDITMEGKNSADGKTSLVIINLGSVFGDLGGLGAGTDLEVEQRIIDGVAYTKNLDILGLGSETWTKKDLSALLESQEAQNPNQYLQYLNAAGADVEKVGSEEINGVETTHYKSVLTKEMLQKQFESEEWKQYYTEQGLSEEDFEKFKRAYLEGLSNTPVDLWVDEDDLPVRMKISTEINASGLTGAADSDGDSRVSSIFTIDFSDWGTDLDIQAPPEDQILTQEEYEAQIRDQLLSQLGA